jgi:hypothetical protein
MSESKATLTARANKLRKQLADAEAVVAGLTLKLAKTEAQLTGQTVPISGLDELWKIALPIARTRSSKHLCRKAWNMLPKGERPTIATMISALKIWNRCREWKKDGNQFVPALDRWIRERRWEDLPEVEQASSRYRTAPKPIPQADPTEAVTDKAEIAALLRIKPLRMNS